MWPSQAFSESHMSSKWCKSESPGAKPLMTSRSIVEEQMGASSPTTRCSAGAPVCFPLPSANTVLIVAPALIGVLMNMLSSWEYAGAT